MMHPNQIWLLFFHDFNRTAPFQYRASININQRNVTSAFGKHYVNTHVWIELTVKTICIHRTYQRLGENAHIFADANVATRACLKVDNTHHCHCHIQAYKQTEWLS